MHLLFLNRVSHWYTQAIRHAYFLSYFKYNSLVLLVFLQYLFKSKIENLYSLLIFLKMQNYLELHWNIYLIISQFVFILLFYLSCFWFSLSQSKLSLKPLYPQRFGIPSQFIRNQIILHFKFLHILYRINLSDISWGIIFVDGSQVYSFKFLWIRH